MNKEISHYEITGFQNITYGILQFSTQFSKQNKLRTWFGRSVIKITTGSSTEHIEFVTRSHKDFVGMQCEDRYNGIYKIQDGYYSSAATQHYDSILTPFLQRILTPSLSDVDNNGKSNWTGDVYIQLIDDKFANSDRHRETFKNTMNLTNRKLWNGIPARYRLFLAMLSPYKSLSRWTRRVLKLNQSATPSAFCDVQVMYHICTAVGITFNLIRTLGMTPQDLLDWVYKKQYTGGKEFIGRWENGKCIQINKEFITAIEKYV